MRPMLQRKISHARACRAILDVHLLVAAMVVSAKLGHAVGASPVLTVALQIAAIATFVLTLADDAVISLAGGYEDTP